MSARKIPALPARSPEQRGGFPSTPSESRCRRDRCRPLLRAAGCLALGLLLAAPLIAADPVVLTVEVKDSSDGKEPRRIDQIRATRIRLRDQTDSVTQTQVVDEPGTIALTEAREPVRTSRRSVVKKSFSPRLKPKTSPFKPKTVAAATRKSPVSRSIAAARSSRPSGRLVLRRSLPTQYAPAHKPSPARASLRSQTYRSSRGTTPATQASSRKPASHSVVRRSISDHDDNRSTRVASRPTPALMPAGESTFTRLQPAEDLGPKTEEKAEAVPTGSGALMGMVPLRHIDLAIARSAGDMPDDIASQTLIDHSAEVLYLPSSVAPGFPHGHMLASDTFCHRPLYFEEINLERYGNSRAPFFQPAISAIKFYGNIGLLPYKMTLRNPKTCYYYRHPFEAGRCAPCWEREIPPLKKMPTLVEAGVVVGLLFTLP